jgi:hypothetical protein
MLITTTHEIPAVVTLPGQRDYYAMTALSGRAKKNSDLLTPERAGAFTVRARRLGWLLQPPSAAGRYGHVGMPNLVPASAFRLVHRDIGGLDVAFDNLPRPL